MNEEVRTVFKYNNYTLNKNLEDISQEDSLKCSDAGGNCINWVVGHIIVTRDALLETLGLEKMCDNRITELYVQGSEAIKPENAEELKNLIKSFNESQKEIMKALNEKDYKEESERSQELAGFGFHEAYHIGQTGILRRIIGKPGVIQ